VAQIIASLFKNEAHVINVTTLQLAKEELHKNKYDLVVLDLMLPDGSAIELLPVLSKNHIPIIVFSAYDLPTDYANYVVKTLVKTKTSPFELLEAIKSSLKVKSIND
jgi:DNA-binding response OmpR family regulator